MLLFPSSHPRKKGPPWVPCDNYTYAVLHHPPSAIAMITWPAPTATIMRPVARASARHNARRTARLDAGMSASGT
jgi:hypothetical protein